MCSKYDIYMQMNDALGSLLGSPNHILGEAVRRSLSIIAPVLVLAKVESATLDLAGHVSVTLLESGAWSEEPSHQDCQSPKGRQLFFYETDTQGDGVASWPPARVLVHAPPVPSPIRVSHISVNDVHK